MKIEVLIIGGGSGGWAVAMFLRREGMFRTMTSELSGDGGATITQGVATSVLRNVDGSLRGIVLRRPDGTEEEIETRVVLDCSVDSTSS